MAVSSSTGDVGWVVRPIVATFALSMLCFGCSKKEPASIFPRAVPGPPVLSIEVRPPSVRDALKPGSPFEVACTVDVPSGAFEPMIAVFQLSDPTFKGDGASRLIIESRGINAKTREGDAYTFTSTLKAPDKPGRYAIDVKVMGVDPSLPSNEPPQAPAADGTQAKPGARAEYEAPALQVEVKK
jgi:hypothetical protein